MKKLLTGIFVVAIAFATIGCQSGGETDDGGTAPQPREMKAESGGGGAGEAKSESVEVK